MISCGHWRQRHRSQQLCCSVGGGCHGDRAGGDAANGLLALLLQGGDHHWETDGQRSALRRRLQQPLLLAQGWVAQVRMFIWLANNLVGGGVGARDILVVGDCFGNLLPSCQGAPGEEMTAGSLDPGKLTLMLIFLQRNCKIKFCKRSAKQLKHLRTAK